MAYQTPTPDPYPEAYTATPPRHNASLTAGMTSATPISNPLQTTASPSPLRPTESAPASANQDLVRRLFIQFLSMYGHLWASRIPTPEARKIALEQWTAALCGEQISAAQIKYGLVKCLDRFGPHVDYPPTLPQFIALCYPSAEELGIPEPEEAYLLAHNKDWERHPIIRETVSSIGSYSFKTAPAHEMKHQFMAIYAKLKKREMLKNSRRITS